MDDKFTVKSVFYKNEPEAATPPPPKVLSYQKTTLHDRTLELREQFRNALRSIEANAKGIVEEDDGEFKEEFEEFRAIEEDEEVHDGLLKLVAPPTKLPSEKKFPVVFRGLDDNCYAFFHLVSVDGWVAYTDHLLKIREQYMKKRSVVPFNKLEEGASVIVKIPLKGKLYFVRAVIVSKTTPSRSIKCLNFDEQVEFRTTKEQIYYPTEASIAVPSRALKCIIEGVELQSDSEVIGKAMKECGIVVGTQLEASLVQEVHEETGATAAPFPTLKVMTTNGDNVADLIKEKIALMVNLLDKKLRF